ncbi:MAG: glycoside hydrolase family 16 protein [Acidimicrobiia bacterium]|jgi:beta-glucanase (GH16 family)|nr:MAG: glycoside hydrolase family 16 protein [Acidimicrobiia bacterium]
MRARRVVTATVASAMVLAACAAETAPTTTAVAAAPETTTTVAPATTAAPTTTTTTVPETTTTTTTTTTIPTPEEIAPIPPEGYELVWSDEFDGDEINVDNWTHEIGGWGWGNGEAQYYTDREKNSRVQNGLLVIELHQEAFENSFYTSARMVTQGKQEFQYGYMEARLKVPAGAGTWPAFWMLGADFGRLEENPDATPWPFSGEIDIMEYVGRKPHVVLGTVHGPGYAGAGGLSKWFPQDFPIADDWHTYAIEWDETGISFFFDDQFYYKVTPELVGDFREYVFDKPYFFLINLAHGGTLGGNIALDLEYPIQYYADYVRVYQRVDT